MDADRPSAPRNRLAGEASAYLRQHAENPVDWWPWCEEALELARREDKPLLVSIGYSACHWCHVMAHESFEDAATAEVMNRLFVNVKVDREERPDVDQIYMDTVVGLTGHGGWPLTVVCRPDGTPFYGGTYFPPAPRHGLPAFRQVLEATAAAYRERRGEVDEAAGRIAEALARRAPRGERRAPGRDALTTAALHLLQQADPDHGGFGTAPKFPTPPNLEALLAASDLLPPRKAQEALDHVALTCRAMARGGLFDQLGGGFHRYSVDEHWGVPHFEKMLYDQGQLLGVYAELARRRPELRAELEWPVRESAEFLRRELRDPDGSYYASLDADSEGREGAFYAWTPQQIEALLGAAAADFCAAHGVSARGNFEHGASVLALRGDAPRDTFRAQRATLLAARAQRERPGTDRKRVLSWNALVASGLARAGTAFDAPELVQEAAACVDFALDHLCDAQGNPLRIWNEGRASVPAFLDDHAALLIALLDLQRATGDARRIDSARRIADAIVARFFDAEHGDFYFAAAEAGTPVLRPHSDHDGATPHSTGLALLGLLRSAALSGAARLLEIAEQVLASHAPQLARAPERVPTLARAAGLAERGLRVAVLIAEPGDPRAVELAHAAQRGLGPDDALVWAEAGAGAPPGLDPAWLAGRTLRDGRAALYLCRGRDCSLPVCDPAEVEALFAERAN